MPGRKSISVPRLPADAPCRAVSAGRRERFLAQSHAKYAKTLTRFFLVSAQSLEQEIDLRRSPEAPQQRLCALRVLCANHSGLFSSPAGPFSHSRRRRADATKALAGALPDRLPQIPEDLVLTPLEVLVDPREPALVLELPAAEGLPVHRGASAEAGARESAGARCSQMHPERSAGVAKGRTRATAREASETPRQGARMRRNRSSAS